MKTISQLAIIAVIAGIGTGAWYYKDQWLSRTVAKTGRGEYGRTELAVDRSSLLFADADTWQVTITLSDKSKSDSTLTVQAVCAT